MISSDLTIGFGLTDCNEPFSHCLAQVQTSILLMEQLLEIGEVGVWAHVFGEIFQNSRKGGSVKMQM